MISEKNLHRISLIILIIIYGVGLTGFLIGYQDLMMNLTPYTLLLSLILLIINHRKWNRFFVIFMLTIMLAGFIVEVIGVETGWLFGEYTYGDTLGYKLIGVPLLIGVNWFILVYSTGMISNLFRINSILRALIGASLMVLLDFSLEPVAIAFDFWSWQDQVIPIQNYVTWFITSFIFQMIFQSADFRRINRLAIILFLVQWVFFLTLSFNLHA